MRHDRTGRIDGPVTDKVADGDDHDLPRPARDRCRRQRSPARLRAGASGGTTAPWGSPSARTTRARHEDEWLGVWLELWDGARQRLLPGYGWVFGVGDGTVNVGLGILNTSTAFGKVDYKALLTAGSNQRRTEWGFREREPRRPVRGAALPMGFNRKPHYAAGCCSSATPAAWSTRSTARASPTRWRSGASRPRSIAQALAARGPAREQVLADYPRAAREEYGGYFTLGRLFVKVIGHPR